MASEVVGELASLLRARDSDEVQLMMLARRGAWMLCKSSFKDQQLRAKDAAIHGTASYAEAPAFFQATSVKTSTPSLQKDRGPANQAERARLLNARAGAERILFKPTLAKVDLDKAV